MHVNTMSTSLGEALLLFVTLALGVAIKECLLLKLCLLMKWTWYAYKFKYGYVDRGIPM